MFEYKEIKARLEDFKCATHNKTAIVSFTDGKLKFEKVCCEEHQKFLLESLAEINPPHNTDILLQSLSGI